MLNSTTSFDKIAISISSFKSTDSVVSLLDKIFSSNIVFSQVIIVDSLSDGSLEAIIKEKDYDVTFFNAMENIGSAGNLNKRLELAAENKENEWCFCVNHDGFFDAESMIKLVSAAESIKAKEVNVGAVFPNRVNYNKSSRPTFNESDEYNEVVWDSSNGSLYALEPYRLGCKVKKELWMGWEDLIYCLQLKDRGYKCFSACKSVYYDNYEYKKVHIFGFNFHIADKPSWYHYYSTRNLLLGLSYLDSKAYLLRKIFVAYSKNIVLTIFFKDNKFKRLKLSFEGFLDGLRNKTGHTEMGFDK